MANLAWQAVRRLFTWLMPLGLALPGVLPAQNFPPMTFLIHDSAASEGYYFLSPYTSYASPLYERPLLVLDRFGHTVFYRIFPPGSHPIPSIDFKLQPNGWMSYFDLSRMKYFFMDSTFVVVDSIGMTHGFETDEHDVQVLPDNHFLLFGLENRVMNLTSYHYFGINHNQPGSANALVSGVVIQEFDEQKDLVWEWKGHDHYQFQDVDPVWLFSPLKVDWTHANAVEKDLDGNILVSLRHFNEITKIDYQTGDIIWRLGGRQNQFSFPNDPVRFTGQHDIRRISPTRVSLFDNGQYTNPQVCRAVEYELDETAKVATLVWEYIHDSSMYSVACGNHQVIANGNHLVDFGFTNDFTFPWMAVVRPDKSKVAEVWMPDGYISYRAFNYPTLPWQLHRPTVDCVKKGDQSFLVAEGGYSAYNWSTGATTPGIQITDTGTYWVFVPYGMGFISSEPITISNLNNPCLYTGAPQAEMPAGTDVRCILNLPSRELRVVFDLPAASRTVASVVTLQGREIARPADGYYSAGTHEATLDISNLARGMYILSFTSENARMARKFTVQ